MDLAHAEWRACIEREVEVPAEIECDLMPEVGKALGERGGYSPVATLQAAAALPVDQEDPHGAWSVVRGLRRGREDRVNVWVESSMTGSYARRTMLRPKLPTAPSPRPDGAQRTKPTAQEREQKRAI